MKSNIFLRTFILLTALLVHSAHADNPAVIRIGVAQPAVGNPPGIAGSTLAVAHAKGWIEEEFKRDNIKVQWYFFKGAGPAVNEALTNDQLDFALQGDLPSIIGRAGGLKTKVILATSTRANIYLAVPPDSTIKSAKDLKGKRVAIFKGTNGQLPINRFLEANGLTEKDIKAINLDTATSQAALTTKDIEAVFGGYELLKLRDKGIARIVYSSKDDSPIFTRQSHILVTENFAKKYPAATQRLVSVLVRTARWSSDESNRDEVFNMWARIGTLTLENWKEDFAGQSLRLRLSPLFDPFLTARYKDAVDQAVKFKLTRKRFDVDQWIDRSYLNTALKEMKLETYWPITQADGK